MKTQKLILSLMLMLPLQAASEIVLPDIVGDGMVVQRNAPARIWGWAEPGQTVEVVGSWNPENVVKGKADASGGKWIVELPVGEAGFEPQTITITADNDRRVVENVLAGEVWFCSGQSNMEMPLRGFPAQPVEGALEAIAYAGCYPAIRVAKVPKRLSYELQDRVESPWKVSSPENAPEFSALAYYYALSLQKLLNVPVGIIDCSYGGSKVESWLPREVIDGYPEFDMEAEKADADFPDWHRAGVMYNAMLHPLAGYTVKGFLWNQGESNVGKHAEYPSHLADMVKTWRDEWNLGELPFYFVELPGWSYGNPEGIDAALFRECQRAAATQIPKAGIVGTADLVYPFEVDDVHARKKKEIGERLAFLAASDAYQIKGMPCRYPELKSMTPAGDKAILTFSNAEGGLAYDYALEGFEVAGDDGVFHPAVAVEDPDRLTVEVSSPEVKKVADVRYCFKNFAVGKVHNLLGLPLMPFRTDK